MLNWTLRSYFIIKIFSNGLNRYTTSLGTRKWKLELLNSNLRASNLTHEEYIILSDRLIRRNLVLVLVLVLVLRFKMQVALIDNEFEFRNQFQNSKKFVFFSWTYDAHYLPTYILETHLKIEPDHLVHSCFGRN